MANKHRYSQAILNAEPLRTLDKILNAEMEKIINKANGSINPKDISFTFGKS